MKGAFSWAGVTNACLFHSNPLYTGALNLRARAFYQDLGGPLMDPMCNDYNKLFVIVDKLLVIMLSYLREAAYAC